MCAVLRTVAEFLNGRAPLHTVFQNDRDSPILDSVKLPRSYRKNPSNCSNRKIRFRKIREKNREIAAGTAIVVQNNGDTILQFDSTLGTK